VNHYKIFLMCGMQRAVPREAKNFLRWRIRPIAEKLGTHLSSHATLKDTQGELRHVSITTTGNVYVQVVEENVIRAVNSHATKVLEGSTTAVDMKGSTGRNVKRLPQPSWGAWAIW
jgi:hypothetical protein